MMNRIFICIIAITAILTGCAKLSTSENNDIKKRYFDAWASVHYPEAQQTPLGSYIIEMEDGDSDNPVISDSLYIRAEYTIWGLDGTVSSTTSVKLSQQVGSYDESYFYGPGIWYRGEGGLYAGISELTNEKHVGLNVKAAIPGWLVTTNTYDTAQEYLDNESGVSAIYQINVVEVFNDVTKWEVDSVVRYLRRHHPEVDPADTISANPDSLYNKKYGFYYIQNTPSPYPDTTLDESASVYINYIGRLLDGRVFDTSMKDTAKYYGIYNSSSSYGPVLINWGANYDALTMTSSGSEIIDGFKFAIYQMKPYESGRTIFFSGYGYSYSGSGQNIPPYSPLIFDIELVDNE